MIGVYLLSCLINMVQSTQPQVKQKFISSWNVCKEFSYTYTHIIYFFFLISFFLFLCVINSRKTGHYSLEHNQSTQQQEDKYGPSLATSGTGASNTESGSSSAAHPGSQPSSSPKLGSSPRHSPNSKPRKQPTCQRSFSQVRREGI